MKRRSVLSVLFTVYCALMLWLLFNRPGYIEGIPYWEQLMPNLNLIPCRTLRLFFGLLDDHRPHLVRAALINLLGNVVMFVPLGLFLPFLFVPLRKLWRAMVTASLLIAAVEITQLFTLVGSCDVDDLLLNLLGTALGYGLYKLTAKPDC